MLWSEVHHPKKYICNLRPHLKKTPWLKALWVQLKGCLKSIISVYFHSMLCCFIYTMSDAHLNIYRTVSFCSNWQTSVFLYIDIHHEYCGAGFRVPLSGDFSAMNVWLIYSFKGKVFPSIFPEDVRRGDQEHPFANSYHLWTTILKWQVLFLQAMHAY